MLVTTVCSWGVIVLSVIMLVLVGLFIVEAALVSGVSAGEAWFMMSAPLVSLGFGIDFVFSFWTVLGYLTVVAFCGTIFVSAVTDIPQTAARPVATPDYQGEAQEKEA